MATVPTTLDPVHMVLWERPYCPWDLVPLAAYLCTADYPDEGRHAILDAVSAGASLTSLVRSGSIEPEHLGPAAAALHEGRTEGWMGRYRDRGHRLPPICGGCSDDDRSVPPTAAIVPPELEALDELLGADDDTGEYPPVMVPDAPDWHVTQRPGYREALAADGIELVDEGGGTLPPIAGGSGPTAEDWAEYRQWADRLEGTEEPTAAEWERLYQESRVPMYGYE